MELNDFDKAFIKFLSLRTPCEYFEIEWLYKKTNKSLDATCAYIELAHTLNITLVKALDVKAFYSEESKEGAKTVIRLFDGTEEILKR